MNHEAMSDRSEVKNVKAREVPALLGRLTIDIDMRMEAGEVLSREGQTEIDLVVNGCKIGVYNLNSCDLRGRLGGKKRKK